MSYAFSQHGVGSAGGFSASEPASSLYGDLAFGGSLVPGTKRSLEDVLYDTWWMPRVLAWVAPYQSEILMMLIKSVFKSYVPHLRIGQTEALFSSNSLIKHLRLETGSNLPIYPQRPGAKDCAHYMTTRTCKFGDACKFDHPIWVPEGGVPGWKEIPLIPSNESFPERPGEPDCPYYMKTQSCKFGVSCKFNHPKHVSTRELGEGVAEASDTSILPERPSEPVCSFYMKTGKCKFGANCKFHHPKDLAPSNEEDSGKITQQDAAAASTCISFTPALLHNSKGLPIRLGEVDCPFYLKTGSCKYGSNCCYNHPDRNTINPPLVAGIGQNILPSAVANYSIGVLNPVPTFLQNIDLQSAQGSLGVIPALYPQRPGEIDCDFYMKTGYCKFGERCKFHHPIDRSAQILDAKQALQQTVKYTLADLPRREGVASCSFFMKTGTCKFGPACKFNHPTGDDGKGGGT